MGKTRVQHPSTTAPTGGGARLALIGCGAIVEKYYLPALARHPAVLKNVILVDSNRARVQSLARQFNVSNWRVDYRQVLEEVEGAIVATPISLHYPISIEFLSRGVHVLCEKPLAESWDKAREMVEGARTGGAVLAVDYLQRLIPPFAKVKELLAAKTLGEPLSLQYRVGEEFDWPTVSGFYFNSNASSRGVLRDRGAHVFDHICWWLGGKPKLIKCQTDSFGGSEAVAYVEFEHNRCLGEVKLSWLSTFPSTFSAKCQGGTVTGDVYDYQSLLLETPSRWKEVLRFKAQSKLEIGNRLVSNFIGVISRGDKPLISGGEVLDSIRFIDECYEAATRFEMPWYDMPEVMHGA